MTGCCRTSVCGQRQSYAPKDSLTPMTPSGRTSRLKVGTTGVSVAAWLHHTHFATARRRVINRVGLEFIILSRNPGFGLVARRRTCLNSRPTGGCLV
jgi:hypothetical protein